MSARKQAPRPRSGWVSEDDRHTERLTLRLAPGTMAKLRALADGWGVKVSEAVTRLVEKESKG